MRGCIQMIRVLSDLDAVQYWNLRLQALQMNPEAFVTTYEEAMQKKTLLRKLFEI